MPTTDPRAGAEQHVPAPASPAPGHQELRRILWQLLWATAAIVLVVAAVLILLRDELLVVSEYFVETFGGIGVAMGFFLPDAFTVPLPNDAFTFLAYTGGMPFWTCVAWGTAGSLAGGTVGFYIGRGFQKTRWFRTLMERRGKQVADLTRRYGKLTLLLGALTPLPYSLTCWAVGAGGMSLSWFLVISSTRFLKVTLYLWLLAEGVLGSFGGPV